MTAQKIQLECSERITGDAGFRKRAKTRVDAVHRFIRRSLAIDNGACGIDARGHSSVERGRLVLVGDRDQLAERKRITVKEDRQYLSRILQV